MFSGGPDFAHKNWHVLVSSMASASATSRFWKVKIYVTLTQVCVEGLEHLEQ